MPSRVSLNTYPQASRKVISNVRSPDHPQTGGSDVGVGKPFTSALNLRPPLLRRRGSDGGSPRSRDSPNHYAGSISMDSPTDPHPLRRSTTLKAKTARDDTGSTRPRLSRVLSENTSIPDKLPDPPPGPLPDKAESHRTVLAHEVAPNDTLAGVALKYGISVTELRRANQLWASDSIHLRQVLYVPLDMARHADPETVASLLAQKADCEDAVHDAPAPHHLDRRTLDPSPMVQRIPSTSLSFFPPPSSRPSTPPPSQERLTSMSSTSLLLPRSYSSATIATPSRGPSLRSNALSSLFSILPINASTRDEIMSRLSIDNVSIPTTASDEAEHELTAVPTTSKHPASTSGTSFADSLATNSQRQRQRPTRTWLTESSKPNGNQEPYLRDVEQIALASSPIHTTQMQPAAAMQLPESITRSPPKGPPPPSDPHNGTWRPSGGDHRRIR